MFNHATLNTKGERKLKFLRDNTTITW